MTARDPRVVAEQLQRFLRATDQLQRPMFGIWCQVSGGATGNRAAWMTSNGDPVLFDTLEEAAAKAKALSDSRNSNPYRTASFSYQALPVSGGRL